MSFFVQTLVIARPRMAADLDGMALYSWSISIPSLAAAFVTLLFSKFSDMYGRRIMLLISMVVYLVGTILQRHQSDIPFSDCGQHPVSCGQRGAHAALLFGAGRHVSARGTQQVGGAAEYPAGNLRADRSDTGRMDGRPLQLAASLLDGSAAAGFLR